MATYRCRVAKDSGEIAMLTREGASRTSVARELATDGFYALEIREINRRRGGGGRISLSELSDFSITLSHMLASGLSIQDALSVAGTIFTRGAVGGLIGRIGDSLSQGGTFSEAIAAERRRLPAIFVGLIEVGERIGSLDVVFERLAEYLLESKKLRDRALSALTYPILVLSIAVIGVVLVTTVLLPRLGDLFRSLATEMPESVSRSLAIAGSAAVVVPVAIGVACAGFAGIMIARRRSGAFRLRVDRFLLRIPFLGGFIASRESVFFTFGMEVMLGGGVPMEEALDSVSAVVSNRIYGRAISEARRRVTAGGNLSDAFLTEPAIPQRLGQWLSVGERTGRLDEVFGQLRRYFQSEVDRWTNRFMSLVEPALIIVVGVIIMAIVLLFIVPVFTAYGSIF